MSSARLAGCLTGPCVSANLGVGDILEGQLFAYGVGSGITIVDLFAFKILCTLQGGHGKIPVTAIAWHPDCHSRDLRSVTHLRCASGDGEGHVVVWDVLRVSVLFNLNDSKISFEHSEGVKCLAWVMHHPSLLAVVLGPSTVVLWDATRSGGVVWHRDLAGVGSLHSLSVDPLDRRSVCLCGSNGVCLLICFCETFEKTTVKQYRVSSSGAATKLPYSLHCMFPNMQNTLLVMLSTEILVFDVEFGQPLGSISLPKTFKPFKKILGVYGHSASYGAGHTGGTDTIYALHEDDTLTTWNRASDSLSFSMGIRSKLVPKPLRGMHGSQIHIMTSCGCLWRNVSTELPETVQDLSNSESSRDFTFPQKSMLIVNVMSNGQLWRWHTAVPEMPPRNDKLEGSSNNLINLSDWNEDSKADALLQELEDQTETLQAPDQEGVVQEAAPQIEEAINSFKPALDRILFTLTGSVTHLSVLPLCLSNGKVLDEEDEAMVDPVDDAELDIVSEEAPEQTPRIVLPDQPSAAVSNGSARLQRTRTPVLAAVTSTGSLEIISLQKGCLTAIHPEINRSYSVHEFRCRSVRWLGNGPLVVSFSSEKVDRLWKNHIVLTDVRSGESVPFRVMPPEAAAMLGIRASPAGKYVVVLLKDAPSEIWLVEPSMPQFSLNDNLGHGFETRQESASFGDSIYSCGLGAARTHSSTLCPQQRLVLPSATWTVGPFGRRVDTESTPEEFPLETLVFTVSDGRVGKIPLQGKKVINSEVRLPGWGTFGSASPVGRCISIAAVKDLVFLGDYDGNLIQWNLQSGKCESVFTDSGPVRRILINSYLRNGASSIRVAILSATWKCSLYDVDERGKLFRSTFLSSFSLMDIAWLPSLHRSGISTLLSGITEEGNVVVIEMDVPEIIKNRINQATLTNHISKKREMDVVEESMDNLSGHASVATTLALPKSLTLLLRLLLQMGLPVSVFDGILYPESTDVDASELEDQVWKTLPANLRHLASANSCQSPSLPSPSAQSGSELPSTARVGEERGVSDAKKRARRRATLLDVSRGMSLASEVLKSIEAQNMKSRGILSRVKGSLVRRPTKDSAAAPVHSSVGSAEATRQWSTTESLLDMLNVLALLRCEGRLFLPEEWMAYQSALQQDSIAARMAVAAFVSGDSAEVEFWRNLSTTLARVRDYAQPDTTMPSPQGAPLWDEGSTVSLAQARASLHDTIPRTHIESHPELQEKRLLEYVSLGDYHTAVGFLLSSAPEASVRYYRDSLCAYALSSVGSSESMMSPTGSPFHGQERSSLHLQVAKVVSAHAASMGDSLLGVPLLCAAGLHHEAVGLLQDAGLWSYASVLTASTLEGSRHAIACLRWAQYVWRYEGSLWRALGILTTGGCLREAAQVLLDEGYIDCAAAYCTACQEFGLTLPLGQDSEPTQLYSALPGSQLVRVSSTKPTLQGVRPSGDEDLSRYSVTSIMNAYNDYITAILTGL